MRILFLTQVLPYPLDAGPKIRAYYTLRYLAQRHEITLLSFVRPSDRPEAVEHLRSFCRAVITVPMLRSPLRDAWHALRSLVGGQPFLIARDWAPAMAARITDHELRVAKYDAVHADQLWMAPYALLARRLQPSTCHLRLILDQHNAVFQIPRRMAQHEGNPLKRAFLELEWRKLARDEAEICRRFDRVVWVTQQDYQAVARQTSNINAPNSAVIPICGDPESTPPAPRRPDARRVTFLGGLHYPPNAQGVLWFVEQVWPRVLPEASDAVLTIIGKNPPEGLRNAQYGTRNLDITGYVADPRPYLEETAVFIVPLLAGGGMRVKIVDAWTWGLPVVSTTVGAEGIETEPGENILLADAPADFARAVVRLLQSPAEAERLAQAGRRWAEQRYNWRTVYRLWDQVYETLDTGE